jgi:hypothetical protein
MGTTKAVSKAAAILGRKGGKVGGKATGASKRRSRLTFRCEQCDREITPAEYKHLADGEAMACPDHPSATILSCPDSSAYYKALRSKPAPCECGQITGEACVARREVTIEHMPEHLRASHEAAGNRGAYPANGAVRLRVSRACAKLLVDDWTRRV